MFKNQDQVQVGRIQNVNMVTARSIIKWGNVERAFNNVAISVPTFGSVELVANMAQINQFFIKSVGNLKQNSRYLFILASSDNVYR